ncbi:tRNA glutamyl-Q(34) synthetase GluQRS [Endozoicomonas sp. OPT23]|uniref:tRNA glutamyl-Q(34) synthetase GluQRS n=1 Tax=Endozoicomonas sp. OPT23 TaxID=2072845 RepID=UPI00129B1E34|nr:tRNA glutamyl-Q(34) synthetase GluQRS [Endozoicomonas sp. OPT23]MRI33097.1 tRNA glutamyl-Q(34) synthetase GluQRS [Endozoicomonas sp. OPT23]
MTNSSSYISSSYIGRFAPSPSGPLHFGSLVAALASYLDARANNGKWLVRMEDIDPPREQAGASDLILKALEVYGLHWDEDVLYQSNRSEAYDQAIEKLQKKDLVYCCTCTRKELRGTNGVYPGNCRGQHQTEKAHSLRVHCPGSAISFNDLIQGTTSSSLNDLGDFIIKRKDGLYAYQLAVCVDDAFQGITHVIRGSDLLFATPWQLSLQTMMEVRSPVYGHFPVITLDDGGKLSKQNHAPAISLDNPVPALIQALNALGQKPEKQLAEGSINDVIEWGVKNWRLNAIASRMEVPLTSL